MMYTGLKSLVVIGVMAVGMSSAWATTVLRLAHTQPTTDTHQAAAEEFAKIVSEKTHGAIEVKVYPGGELGSDSATLQGVRLGTIDMGLTGNPFYTGIEPRLNILDMPYLFTSYKQAYAVLDGPIGEELLAGLEKQGMKGLAFWEIGFRDVTNDKRPIREPADLKDLKIRTTPNPAQIEAFKLWGANPTPMAFTEVYSALQTKTVDGQENPINVIRSNKFQEVQKYLSFTDHAYTASILSMNLRKFNALPKEQQEILVEAAHSAADYQRKLNREQFDSDLKTIKAAGVQVENNVDRAAFKKIVYGPITKEFKAKFGDQIINQIESMASSH